MALGIAALASGIAASPAHADNDDWHRGHEARHEHEWRGHDWREREWREQRAYAVPAYPGYVYGYAPPVYGYAPPPVIYAPPPVVYAPPPVVYAPPPSVNFVFPLRFQ
jgi:hypothetical protein